MEYGYPVLQCLRQVESEILVRGLGGVMALGGKVARKQNVTQDLVILNGRAGCGAAVLQTDDNGHRLKCP